MHVILADFHPASVLAYNCCRFSKPTLDAHIRALIALLHVSSELFSFSNESKRTRIIKIYLCVYIYVCILSLPYTYTRFCISVQTLGDNATRERTVYTPAAACGYIQYVILIELCNVRVKMLSLSLYIYTSYYYYFKSMCLSVEKIQSIR